MHFYTRRLAPAIFIGASFCAHAALSVTPDVVPYGKPAQITVQAPGPGQIALFPGGPYRKSEHAAGGEVIALDGARKVAVVRGGARGVALVDFDGQKLSAIEMPEEVLAARVQGDALLVLMPRTLTLVDIRHPRSPAKLVDLTWPGGNTQVVLAGQNLLQADGENGLAIWRVDEKSAPQLLARHPTTGPARDVAVQDNRAYVAQGEHGLLILDLQDAQQPFWLGSHGKLGDARQVSVSGNAVLVANAAGRISKIEVFNPAQPSFEAAYTLAAAPDAMNYDGKDGWIAAGARIQSVSFDADPPQYTNAGLDVGRGVNFGGQRRADLVGNTLYVADWFSGVHIYDVTDGNDPKMLSTLHTPGSPKGVVVRDGYAFVADDDHGLQVVDVRDARAPKIVANVATRGLAYTPKLAVNLLYLASHRGGFQIIDVSAPTAPRVIADVETPGMAWSLALAGERLYVADDAGGLLMYDVATPATPRLIGAYDAGGRLEEVLVRDGIVYLAYFDLGLKVVDLRDADAPRVLAEFATPGNARGLDLQANTLYIADWLGGVHALDVTDPAQPRSVWSYDTPGAAWGVRAHGKKIFVLDWWGGLAVLHETERAPRITRYAERGNVHQIAARDDYLYIAHGDGGLQVFDIKNPLNPTWVTGVEELRGASAIALAGDYAYVGLANGRLAVADISSPFAPRIAAIMQGSGALQRLAIAGNKLYALTGTDVETWDIANPVQPRGPQRRSRRANAPVHYYDIAAVDGTVYRASSAGLERSKPDGSWGPPWPFAEPQSRISASGDHVAAANDAGALTLYQRSGETLRLRGRIDLRSEVRDLEFAGERLYASTAAGIAVIDAAATPPVIAAQYPLPVRARGITPHGGILYLGGENTVTALKPLPDMRASTSDAGEGRLALPADFPMGAYDVAYLSATPELARNALRVEMPRFGKPKFTTEDLKKAMEQIKQRPAQK